MFEHSLISLDSKKPIRRRWLSLPIAVALHVAALGAFTFASYWHVERVAEPMVNEPFITVSLPALPQAKSKLGGAPPPQAQKAAVPVPARTEVIQPQKPADKLPTLDTPSMNITLVDIPVGPGSPLGDKDGDSHGSDDGVLGAPANPDGSGKGGGHEIAVPVDEPIRVTGAVTRPVLVDGPQPRYTEMARRAGVQGTVIVEAIIDETGHVTDVRILKALPMGLDRAAVEAVQTWRFKPATLAGRPVKVYYTLTANFTLQH
ncbi:MAG TPA: energy transducer TonB [Thermoanaerobaculia bacterium]|jgi:protein TonB|nr:energy transducer TonB [Thermoanaerobaculia bacterium]